MAIFEKKKKGSTEGKDKKKAKKIQDRWMVRALRAKFPDTKSSDMLEFDFSNAFSEHNLKVTGGRTDRTLLGRGNFDKPYQQAKVVTRRYGRFISGDEDPSDDQVTEMVTELEKLKTLASEWLQSAEAKWSLKGNDKQDSTTQTKVMEARAMVKGAGTTIFQLQNRAQLKSGKTAKLIADLETATKSRNVEAYRSADAALLTEVCGSFHPDSGTSDVQLIKGPDGDVAFAFKSVAGESDMMGTKKGFATAREVLMSKMCEGIKEKYGLDFPWPNATMAKVGGEAGALIDGVAGIKAGGAELSMADVPAEALQKILLCNLAGGQFDIKWEDVRFTQNQGKLEATCMDGGAAMPDPDTAVNFLAGLSDGKPGQQIIDNGDPSTGGFYPEALKPMSPELVKQFLSINTRDLKADMEAQARLLERDHGLSVTELGLGSGIQTAMTSIEGIQKILNDAAGKITLAKFMEKFHADVIQKKFVEPKLAAWQRKQLAAHRQLLAAHPRLFAPAQPDTDVADIYRDLLHPEVQAHLKELADMAKPGSIADMLESFGKEVPIATVGKSLVNDIKKIQAAIGKGLLPEYDQLMEKYPGVIVPRDSFGDLTQAYAAVLASGQVYGLKQLDELAGQLSKKEPVTLTIAGLLRRYGYALPTSNFKEKYDRIRKDIASKQKNL